MGFHSAKKHKGFSPRQQNSPISSFSNPKRQFKHQAAPQRNAFNFAMTPHHNHLPLRQKLTKTRPTIPPFIPWTPESDPESSKCPLEEDECPASLKKQKVAGKEGLCLGLYQSLAISTNIFLREFQGHQQATCWNQASPLRGGCAVLLSPCKACETG